MKQISKKAYGDLIDRINETFLLMFNDAGMAEAAIAAVDNYLENDILPSADAPVEIKVAFSMLRPEIDRAVERSRKARERAAKRKMAADKSRETVTMPEEKPDNAVESGEAIEDAKKSGGTFFIAPYSSLIMKNRRQRRLEERKSRRFKKKVMRNRSAD